MPRLAFNAIIAMSSPRRFPHVKPTRFNEGIFYDSVLCSRAHQRDRAAQKRRCASARRSTARRSASAPQGRYRGGGKMKLTRRQVVSTGILGGPTSRDETAMCARGYLAKPWRCLCRGFSLHTLYTRRLRRTILHALHSRLTEARTRMATEKRGGEGKGVEKSARPLTLPWEKH